MQNFIAITSLQLEWEQNEISIEFELWWKNCLLTNNWLQHWLGASLESALLLPTAWQSLKHNICQSYDHKRHPIPHPMGELWVSFVRIWEKIGSLIMAPHCFLISGWPWPWCPWGVPQGLQMEPFGRWCSVWGKACFFKPSHHYLFWKKYSTFIYEIFLNKLILSTFHIISSFLSVTGYLTCPIMDRDVFSIQTIDSQYIMARYTTWPQQN